MKACVYTSIFGEYDPLREQVKQNIETDFVAFTDKLPADSCGNWLTVIENRFPELSPRMRSKICKILPEICFHKTEDKFEINRNLNAVGRSAYDCIVYIDGCIKIKNPEFVDFMLSQDLSSGWAMLVHPERDCIYDEYHESMRIHRKKYGSYPLAQQVDRYYKDGHPRNFGLMANTIIIRRATNPLSIIIDRNWWNETIEWSPQCQISLMHVLWKLNVPIGRISLNLWNNQYFDWIPHSSDN